jgi:hypothetical protein
MGADGGRCEVLTQIFKDEEVAGVPRKRLKTIALTVRNWSNQPETIARTVPKVEKPYGKPPEEPFKRRITLRIYVCSRPYNAFLFDGPSCTAAWHYLAAVRVLCENRVIAAETSPGGHWRVPASQVERLKRAGLPPIPRPSPTPNASPADHGTSGGHGSRHTGATWRRQG